MRVAIGLAVTKPHLKKPLGLDLEARREQVVEDIVHRIMGSPDSEAVLLVPDMTGSAHSPRHGKWGVDEPYPFPDLPTADH